MATDLVKMSEKALDESAPLEKNIINEVDAPANAGRTVARGGE